VSGIGEQRIHVYRLEAIRPMAELARNGDRPLLLQNVPDLFGPQGAQQSGNSALVAAALELHGRAPEQAQIVLGEAALQQFLYRARQQVGGTQLFDASLGIVPGFFELRLVRGGCTRHLLNQKSRTALVIGGEINRVGSCSEDAK